jgi:NADH-quinone oxidoreductase subunit M
MISHGIVSGALFLCVGVVYDRMHTREIAAYGGLVNQHAAYAAIFMIFTMANVGLPGTSGFVGEFLTLMGAFKATPGWRLFATTGVILSAGYALWLYRRVVFGRWRRTASSPCRHHAARRPITLVPLVIADYFLVSIRCRSWSDISASVDALITQVHSSLAANAQAPGLALVNLAN